VALAAIIGQDMTKRIHYARRTLARWRSGPWLHQHGAGCAVCMPGSNSPRVAVNDNVTYDRAGVTCKHCLRIAALIDLYERSGLRALMNANEKKSFD
jgi:hypothetical protein